MTIKEIEALTGIPRASIRFYEKEGLLSPERQENGYRIYTEADEAQLKKLKLLRALGLSLEEIRSAMTGDSDLCSLLMARSRAIGQEQDALKNADRVCCRMYREQVTYAALDADLYLEDLQQAVLPAADILPRVQAPWSRYFARYLDGLLLLCLYWGLLTWITQENLMNDSMDFRIGRWLAGLLLVLALEPVLLHFFGTTPGKWIFGLSVTSPEGGHLSWKSALDRTCFALFYGQGLDIPLYSLYRYWKSYRACQDGEILPWESDSILLRKPRPVRTWVMLPLTLLLVFFLSLSLLYIQAVPDCRGTLTLEEFSRNYNQMVKVSADGESQLLDPDGLWISSSQILYGVDLTQEGKPGFQYDLDLGTVTGIRLELTGQGEDWVSAMTLERSLAVSAFVRARHGLFPPGDETEQVLRRLREDPLGNWTLTANGITVTNQAHVQGYDYVDSLGLLMPQDNTPAQFSLSFSMEAAQ